MRAFTWGRGCVFVLAGVTLFGCGGGDANTPVAVVPAPSVATALQPAAPAPAPVVAPPVTTPVEVPTPVPVAQPTAPIEADPGPTQPFAPTNRVQSLGDAAITAMRAGKELEAIQYAQADMAFSKSSDGDAKGTMAWMAIQKRPSVATRWGVGVVYEGNRVVAHPFPILKRAKGPEDYISFANELVANEPELATRQQMAANSGSLGAIGKKKSTTVKPTIFRVPQEPRVLISFFTGDTGVRMVGGLKKKMENGNYGSLLQQAIQGAGTIVSAEANPDPNANPGAVQNTPAGVPPVAASGKYKGSNGIGPLAPGIMSLGEGKNPKELLDRAREHDLDALIIFDVDVKLVNLHGLRGKTMTRKVAQNNNEPPVVQNRTQLFLYDVSAAKVLIQSKPLLNTAVAKDRLEAEKGDIDPVDEAVNRVLTVADEKFARTSLPESATPERVEKHVATKLSETPASKFALLAELRYYNSQKALSDEKFAEACDTIMGRQFMEQARSASPESLLSIVEPLIQREK